MRWCSLGTPRTRAFTADWPLAADLPRRRPCLPGLAAGRRCRRGPAERRRSEGLGRPRLPQRPGAAVNTRFFHPGRRASIPARRLFARGEDRHLASSYDTRCQCDEGLGRGERVTTPAEEIETNRIVPDGAPVCTTPEETAPGGARESGSVAPARTLAVQPQQNSTASQRR